MAILHYSRKCLQQVAIYLILLFFTEHSNQSERQSKCLLNANRHLNLANICHITSGKLSNYKLQQLEVIALELKARLLESLETKVGQSKCGLK